MKWQKLGKYVVFLDNVLLAFWFPYSGVGGGHSEYSYVSGNHFEGATPVALIHVRQLQVTVYLDTFVLCCQMKMYVHVIDRESVKTKVTPVKNRIP